MSYSGQVAIVTGASSGIGRDTALAFATRGAVTVGVARRENRLAELAAECGGLSGRLDYLVGDLGEREFAEHVVAETVRRHGRVDVLVNNAGIPVHKQIYDTTADDVENVMRINFLSSVWTTLAAIPHMLTQGGGTVVNVSSFASKVSPPRETAYAASKCAMDGFTAGLWNDLAGSNIHAALVIPGPIDTEIWDKDESPSAYDGAKYPPRIVTDAIFEAIEKRRHELVVPRRSAQLISARVLRACLPSVLRAGMAWMEPVDPDVIERAREAARASTPKPGSDAPEDT